MRKFAACAVFLFLFAGVAYAKDYTSWKKVGPYDVSISINHTPAVVGVNEVTFEIKKDSSPTNNLDPEIYYFMQSMPAMNYTAHLTRKGESYSAFIKPTMPGEWTLKLKIKGPDGKTHTGTFEFEAK